MQFDVLVSQTKYDQIHEDIFMDCVYEASYDLMRLSADSVIQEKMDKAWHSNIATSTMTKFEILYHVARICYLRHWEDHWESVNSDEAFPYEVEKIFEMMEKHNIPEMTEATLTERMKRHRICGVKKDYTFITVPQQEVW